MVLQILQSDISFYLVIKFDVLTGAKALFIGKKKNYINKALAYKMSQQGSELSCKPDDLIQSLVSWGKKQLTTKACFVNCICM